jgi:hypothetical protein
VRTSLSQAACLVHSPDVREHARLAAPSAAAAGSAGKRARSPTPKPPKKCVLFLFAHVSCAVPWSSHHAAAACRSPKLQKDATPAKRVYPRPPCVQLLLIKSLLLCI